MKRQKRKTTAKKKHASNTGVPPVEPSAPKKKTLNRRDLLQNVGIGAVGAAVVGGGGWYLVSTVHAGIVEGDLSRIGNGIPTVVQIHDPGCPMCRALQREAREALEAFDEDEIQYVVANITQQDGRELASAHGVGHVTLLLFDGSGKRRGVLRGENTAEILEMEFRRLVQRSPSS